MKNARRREPGGKPETLKVKGDWKDAVKDAMKRGKPPKLEKWPEKPFRGITSRVGLVFAITSHYDSMSSPADDPSIIELKPDEARALFRRIVKDGDIEFTGHALVELENDNLHTTDCMNVLRGGEVVGTELRHGKIRYRVATKQMTAIVIVVSDAELCVITAWRNEG